jgi:hypothetical protein
MLFDPTRQLDKTQRLLQQLLSARGGTRSEQLSRDQLRLFAQQAGMELPPAETAGQAAEPQQDSSDDPPPAGSGDATGNTRGRRSLPSHRKRERMVHDLSEEEKHCAECHQDLRHIGEEVSERYEYVPAQMLVIGSW